MLLIGLLNMSCSDYFLIETRTTGPGMVPVTGAGKKIPYRLSYSPSYRDIFSAEAPFNTFNSSSCQLDIKVASTLRHYGALAV